MILCLFQGFDILVYAVQFARDVNLLWAMWSALAAAYAVRCLPQPWHGAVVTHQECAARLCVVLVLHAGRHVAFVDAAVVVQQDGWNVNAVGAWHAICI